MSVGKYSFACSEIVNGIIVDGEFKDPRKFSKFGNIPNIVGKHVLDNVCVLSDPLFFLLLFHYVFHRQYS